MSRSFRNKCGKYIGFDYTSRREGNLGACQCPGKYGGKEVKKQTNRIERRKNKNLIKKELKDEQIL